MIKIFIQLILFTHFGVVPETSSTIEGKVTSDGTNKAIFSCTVTLYRAKVKVATTSTDINGNYFFSSVQPGKHDLVFVYDSYTKQKQINIPVKPGRTHRIDVQLTPYHMLENVQIIEYKEAFVTRDSNCPAFTIYEKTPLLPSKPLMEITRQSVKRLPGKRY